MIRAAQLGEAGADAGIEKWLGSHPKATNVQQRALYQRLCADFTIHGDYAPGAAACGKATALGADDDQSAANNRKLRNTPAIRAIGSGRISLTPNGLGSRDALIKVNGTSAPWLVDTGAQIAVVTQSLATEIGVRRLQGQITVGSTTAPVQGGLGIIDVLWIGGAALENVPVLVLPDAQLKIANLPQIRAIFGLPELVAFRRVEWLDKGKTLALGDEAEKVAAASPQVYWHKEGIGIPVSTDLGTRGAHLDTGANDSYLRAPAHVLLGPAVEATAEVHKGRVGGAGGVVETNEKVYPTLGLTVAGIPLNFKKISINEQDHEGVARLGDDVIQQLTVLVLDFEHMRIEARK
ncbi:MAG TPA: retropepsin-like aspartic protease [Steroidobacteraceae bacterium]|nr:retropepsin-like aspartic protease [Steroidobacteraceae bacterium]